MYQELDVERHRSRPPSLLNTFTEFPRTLIDMAALVSAMPKLNLLPRGERHPVLILPGFLAGDESTFMLRRYLLQMGYEPLPWVLGRNNGKRELFEQRLVDKFSQLYEIYGEKITLIGQSLGGVFARDLARNYPQKIRQVITLGSPFGSMSHRSAQSLASSLFQQQSGISVDEMIDRLEQVNRPVPVPSTAIYSKGDGVVNWRVCREADGHETQSIEVRGSHCGMGFNPAIYHIIADRLAQNIHQWQHFDCDSLKRTRYTSSFALTF